MKASEKIKGIVFAYDTNGEYDMVKELGVEWMRLNICFPWKDKMFGTLSEEYIAARQEIRDTHAKGFQVMPATPPLGGFTYDEEEGKHAGMSISRSSWERRGRKSFMKM